MKLVVSEESPLLVPHENKHEDETVVIKDAVTSGVSRLCFSWFFIIGMWYLSFLVKVMEDLLPEEFHWSRVMNVSLVFIPM